MERLIERNTSLRIHILIWDMAWIFTVQRRNAPQHATGIVGTEPARLAVVGKMTGQPACNLIPLFADPGLIHINELLEKARFNPPTPSGAEPN
jgi:hypothetical protein